MQREDRVNMALVNAAALLAAVAALCEQLSVLFISVRAVTAFMLLSFVFDMLFTAVFASDIASAVRRKKTKYFMLYGGGLVDFAASVPLLIFCSAPSVIVLAAGGGSAAAGFMKDVAGFWGMLSVTCMLRVSRMARLVSLPGLAGTGMAGRHLSTICAIIAASLLPAAPLIALVMRRAGVARADAVTGFAAGFMLFMIFSVLIPLYSRHFVGTVSSVLDALDRGLRRREFYLKVRAREEFSDEGVYRLVSFYNESYLPAKIRQNVKSPEPAAYRVPEDEVKNFIRSR
ncbi:MAG: hypothetical protein GXY14_01990 [Spirochaetes bacterium]|nr:hypothetical protein [Spirochaetota bacterium]